MTDENEYHVASFVAHAEPKQKHSVAEKIALIDGAEIHAVSDEGKVVFTVEADSQRTISNKTDEIKYYDGVLSLSPIYHQFLTEEAN